MASALPITSGRDRLQAVRTVQVADKLPYGKRLDTVASYTHERMVEALSLYAALGYVGTGRRGVDGRARLYPRRTTQARPG
jgi:hypothetical protein